MTSDQKRLWARFHDVINDNTCKTNKYLMPLSVFIVIDSDQRSRIAAIAVVCDETTSTYEWILEQTKLATGGIQPITLFTDADPASCNIKSISWYNCITLCISYSPKFDIVNVYCIHLNHVGHMHLPNVPFQQIPIQHNG